jgi:DNA (cytosine-5)-methyltransferase 1
MEGLGYHSKYQVLNAKDYGIPQNRERVFTISILKEKIIYDDYNSRVRRDQDTIGTLTSNCGASAIRNGWKVITSSCDFKWPEPIELTKKLKDILEDEVDEKYYLSDEQVASFKASTAKAQAKGNGFKFEPIERE